MKLDLIKYVSFQEAGGLNLQIELWSYFPPGQLVGVCFVYIFDHVTFADNL